MESKEQAHLILKITENGLKHQRFTYETLAQNIGIKPEDEVYAYTLLATDALDGASLPACTLINYSPSIFCSAKSPSCPEFITLCFKF